MGNFATMDPSTAAYQPPGVDPSQMPPQQPPGAAPQQPPQQPLDPQSDPELQAAAIHHSRLASALSSVGDILGGNKTLHLIKNADGSVSVQQTDATPGEKWGRVAQAALSGAAKGFEVGQGPGGAQRAAAAGIQSGMAMPQQQQDQTLATADRANDQNQKAQMFKANMALLNQRVIAGAFDMKQKQIQAGEGEDDRMDRIQAQMQHLNANKQHFATMDALANAYNTDSALQQAHHDGRTVAFKSFDANGNVTGVDAYIIPEDKMNKLYDKPYTRSRLQWDGDSDHKPAPGKEDPIDPNTMTVAQMMAMHQADEDNDTKIGVEYNKATGIAAQAKATMAQAAATRAEAASARAATDAAVREAAKKEDPNDIPYIAAALSNPLTGAHLSDFKAASHGEILKYMNEHDQQLQQKLTGQELTRADSARIALPYIERAQAIVNKRPDLFGPAGWMRSKFAQAVNGGDPDAKDFQTQMTLANLPMVSMHGFRGRYGVEDLKNLDSDLYTNRAAMNNILEDLHTGATSISKDGGRTIPAALQKTPAPTGLAGNTSQAARAPGGPPPPPPPPKFGDVVQGHKYVGPPGSNPADPRNWQALPPGAVQ